MDIYCKDSHDHMKADLQLQKNEKKTFWVLIITSVMMVAEITAGYFTNSMALFADGWHMASHAGALMIAFLAYRLATHPSMSKHFSFGTGKLIPLGGYTSAIVLTMIAILMVIESVQRLLDPKAINFDEAIAVACLGLVVNIVSAVILNDQHSHHGHSHGDQDHEHNESDHHDHSHEHEDDHAHHEHDHHHEHAHAKSDHAPTYVVHDLNLRSAFIHVIADAFVSVLAILALIVAKNFGYLWLDPTIGIVGSVVIFSWAFQLCKQTAFELLDGHSRVVDMHKLRNLVEVNGAQIIDFHVWRVAPNAISCELVVKSVQTRGSQYYRDLLQKTFNIQHVVIEEIS